MKKIKILFMCSSLFLSGDLIAQVTFPAGTNLCETTPWKLVWDEEFNQNALDANKWVTFSEDGDWDANGNLYNPPISTQPRQGTKVNYLQQNVVVGNGTCKLIAKYQPNTWYNSTKDFSGGYIKSIHKNNGNTQVQYFQRGRFEIRARISQAKKLSATFWLWKGGSAPGYAPQGSEIDIYEYQPDNDNTSGDNSLNDIRFTLHGWQRPSSPNNSTSDQSHVAVNVGNWHTYACEWDANFVRLYVDGILQVTKQRYSKLIGGVSVPGDGCNPVAGTTYYNDYLATFPFAEETMSLVASLDYLHDFDGGAGTPDRTYEIDYIRVYQRTPQSDLHEICGTINGPTQICADNVATTYTYNGDGFADGNGTWQVSSNLSIVSSSNTSITVKRLFAVQTATISVVNPNMYCPSNTISINTGIPDPVASVTSTYTAGHYSNSLHVASPAPNTTYHWNIITNKSPLAGVTSDGLSASAISNYTPLCFYLQSTGSCGSATTYYGNCTWLRPSHPVDSNTTSGNNINEPIEGKFDLKIFPNPAYDKLNITLTGGTTIGGKILIKIIDVNGKEIYYGDQVLNGDNSFVIDISKFTSGLYLIDFISGSEITHEKFVKQ